MVDLSKYDQIIIWGACFPPEGGCDATSHGYAADKLYSLLEKNGYATKLVFFVDSNTQIHGLKRCGILIKAPCEILKYSNAVIIINSLSINAIMNDMEQMGINNDILIIPYYFYHGVLGVPYNNEKAKSVIDNHDIEIRDLFYLDDPETARYLNIIFSLRSKCDDDLYTKNFYAGTGNSLDYFCDDTIAPKGDVTYIDVGAFKGESIEPIRRKYGNRLKYCMAFEPDVESMRDLKKYISDNELDSIVEALPYALGNEEKYIQFLKSGSTSQVSKTGDTQIMQKRFDDLPDKKVAGDVMVKMDIEGAELDALQGMEKFIKAYKPYLAICIYHKETDIYEIPRFLKKVCPEYRLYIRGGWHLECWAVPE
ncbi:MAG: FkbM family methyltransferase [Lachnospiraceae bacterium]|nr:FkbM family methyltransferase [Lachnospiraceae bacterium]